MAYKIALNTFWILVIIFAIFLINETDSACTFPSDVINKNWTSSIFDDMLFQTNDVNFTVIINPTILTSWTCHINSGTKYVIQSKETATIFSTLSYFYYCLDLRRQGDDSYLFYLQSPEALPDMRFVSKDINITVSLSDVCTETLDIAEYHVMINSASPTAVKYDCASPLLADFTYACSAGTNDTGTTSTCPIRTSFTFNNTVCSTTDKVLFSESGEFNCIATTSTQISGDTVYYQTLYNLDSTTPDDLTTFQFVCLAVTKYTNGTVILSATGTECTAGQTATANTLYTLSPTVECPITESDSQSSTDITPIIIGVVVAVVVLLIIIGILVFYFCFYKKDPNAGKPIVENTKPKFEDPDKEDIIEDLELVDTMASPVTRDEITFEAMSPSIISNGRYGNTMAMSPTTETHGGYAHNGMANGSLRRDSGIAMTETSMDRPIPRMGINPTRESMVIFNGDEKVISGNDTRIVPNENPNARTIHMDTSGVGTLTLHELKDDEELDALGELSPSDRDSLPFPSLPREKSNLMPPIETSDPEKDGH